MNDLKEYVVSVNVGASISSNVMAASVDDALEEANYHASLCYHCSREVELHDGDDVCVYLDGEVVYENDYYSNRFKAMQREIDRLKAENKCLKNAMTAIEKHQASVAGDACNMSTTWQLANSALLGCD